ncbi:MAG: hypothetical protein JWM88_250 [Verrucomicrobia bacterium]|nr:hypothetical protein [Verrucomicrobiota bacterium]
MNKDEFSPRNRLLTYLDLFVRGAMDAPSFAGNFEQVYNLELNKADLSATEAAAFANLFEKVAWFTPIEEERQKIPNYVGEPELLSEARKAQLVVRKDAPD